jgi:hypothetical protein
MATARRPGARPAGPRFRRTRRGAVHGAVSPKGAEALTVTPKFDTIAQFDGLQVPRRCAGNAPCSGRPWDDAASTGSRHLAARTTCRRGGGQSPHALQWPAGCRHRGCKRASDNSHGTPLMRRLAGCGITIRVIFVASASGCRPRTARSIGEHRRASESIAEHRCENAVPETWSPGGNGKRRAVMLSTCRMSVTHCSGGDTRIRASTALNRPDWRDGRVGEHRDG